MKIKRAINKAIIHCADTPEGVYFDKKDIYKWHVKERNFSDIGYHFIVLLDGTIEVCRPLEKSGAHCKGQNSNSIGICYIGGRDKTKAKKAKDTRTVKQKISLKNLLATLKAFYPKLLIEGHNKYSDKSCPSFDVKKEYENV